MTSRTLPMRLAAVAAVLAVSWGCGGGDGLPRQAISGKVTLDGQPLESALVTFTPTGAGGDSTSGAAQVSSGSFSIPKADGLIPGNYRVSVSVPKEVPVKASRKKETDSVTGEEIAPPTTALGEALPERYNAQSELTADVAEAGPNDFTFAVTSK
ncbi:carboxypeptidase-like regulatory domain-containing protein [Paludisphaera soli]|uniref:carboxypeptidase-like regulatory domain-containing protein n=1 Tax=Paludisphaera soli TaxID=2712865 RepID=UPI0013EC2336|nr:carboxypeptidase-like regulatory domain-containing protein [Paludisphaera soli]